MVQFHPEAVIVNRNQDLDIPVSIHSIRASLNLANFFVNEARINNNNEFDKFHRSKYKFIDSFVDIPTYDSG
jgi:hypothetical protein